MSRRVSRCGRSPAGLGRAPSTVSREIAANHGGLAAIGRWSRIGRRCDGLVDRSRRSWRCSRSLCALVEAKLELRWSPRADLGLAVGDLSRRPEMRVSHETIYLSLFVQSRGALRKELTRYLRRGQATRRPRGRRDLQRWPGQDPSDGQHQRTTRRGRGPGGAGPLGRRPGLRHRHDSADGHPGRAPQPVRDARRAAQRPHRRCRRRRALRQDRRAARTAPPIAHLGPGQGDGPPRHASPSTPACPSTSATRTAPGSAAPTRTPTDCSASTSRSAQPLPLDQADLDAVADELNGRPRQTLGWKTPSQVLDQALR